MSLLKGIDNFMTGARKDIGDALTSARTFFTSSFKETPVESLGGSGGQAFVFTPESSTVVIGKRRPLSAEEARIAALEVMRTKGEECFNLMLDSVEAKVHEVSAQGFQGFDEMDVQKCLSVDQRRYVTPEVKEKLSVALKERGFSVTWAKTKTRQEIGSFGYSNYYTIDTLNVRWDEIPS